MRDHLLQRLDLTLDALAHVREQIDVVHTIGERLCASIREGGVIYAAGNGGSAAQAMHFTEELIGRYRGDRPGRAAICLNADPTALTCIANDFGYDEVFARQVRALAGAGDVFVGFSTSGNSANVVRALEAARDAGAATFALLGRDGGRCQGIASSSIVIPLEDSAAIQDAHQSVLHLWCEMVELDASA